MEVKRGEVADTLLTLLKFKVGNGCPPRVTQGHLIGYSSCEKSKKTSKLNQQVGFVDYEGHSKD